MSKIIGTLIYKITVNHLMLIFLGGFLTHVSVYTYNKIEMI